ncbi:hypothetical protein [Granulicoccus sp. GXG6511]|uniref:hypothetical protein n=1 Tax=Granulicoccus sp. GXG6511 TaxID=3381351 RepID=UPI003D7D4146
MPSRPGHDAPEELSDARGTGGVRISGAGTREELVEPGVHLVPMGRWVVPAFLLVTFVAAVTVFVISVMPLLRPVHLPAERAGALFEPALAVDGREWSGPGELEPDRFFARFCGGVLLRIVESADRAMVSTGRGERPGNALTLVFPTGEAAEVAYAELGAGIDGCRTRGQQWARVESAPDVSADVTGFHSTSPRARRASHLLLVRSANTMTLFMTATPPDGEATARAYVQRVAAVARAE